MFGFQTRNELKRLKQIWRPATHQYTRRADAAVLPMDNSKGRSTYASHLNQSALFFGFESNQSTCAIKISNPKQKSRAAIILLRGRVLSCVYGKHDLDYHIYGEDAYHSLQIDLSNPLTEFTAYPLTEELALASASIFQGFQKKQKSHQPLSEFVQKVCGEIREKQRPGCVVLKDEENHSRFVFYISPGEVFAIYSFKDGWLDDSSYANAKRIASKSDDLFGEAFMLSANTMEQIWDLTFKLCPLADSLSGKLRWTTGTVNQDALMPMDLHATGPNLSDTFNFGPEDDHRHALKVVAKYSQRHKPHSHYLDPNR